MLFPVLCRSAELETCCGNDVEIQFIANGKRFTYKNYRQKKPPEALPRWEAKNQAEHEEELLGGITPGGS